jgi:hypothetical protein
MPRCLLMSLSMRYTSVQKFSGSSFGISYRKVHFIKSPALGQDTRSVDGSEEIVETER